MLIDNSWIYKLIAIVSLYFLVFLPKSAHAQTPPQNKRVEVNLSAQTLTTFQGNTALNSFPISSGKWAPTPTGTFYPWAKLSSTRMTGGNKALGTYYDLPNVPYTIYFYQGYAIHGAYWHNNFGRPMSHGCVNMRISDAAVVYNFTDYTTPIVIYGQAPIN